jgi:hypothetical protein
MSNADKIVEKAEKVGSALASLIPQLFFDLIGRIVPGFVISCMFLGTASFLGSKSVKWNSLVDWYTLHEKTVDNHFALAIVLLIAFIYNISVVFYGIWAAFMHILYGIFVWCDNTIITTGAARKGRHCMKACFRTIRHCFHGVFVEVVEACPDFSFRHDFVKLNAPIAGSRITKLKAEIHMSGSLTAAFIIVFFFAWRLSANLWILSIFLLSAFGCFFSNRHFTKRLHRSVNSYSVLIGYPENKYKYPRYRVHAKISSYRGMMTLGFIVIMLSGAIWLLIHFIG